MLAAGKVVSTPGVVCVWAIPMCGVLARPAWWVAEQMMARWHVRCARAAAHKPTRRSSAGFTRRVSSSGSNMSTLISALVRMGRAHTRGEPGKTTVWKPRLWGLRPRDERGHAPASSSLPHTVCVC